jgi:hypothetical protein
MEHCSYGGVSTTANPFQRKEVVSQIRRKMVYLG